MHFKRWKLFAYKGNAVAVSCEVRGFSAWLKNFGEPDDCKSGRAQLHSCPTSCMEVYLLLEFYLYRNNEMQVLLSRSHFAYIAGLGI